MNAKQIEDGAIQAMIVSPKLWSEAFGRYGITPDSFCFQPNRMIAEQAEALIGKGMKEPDIMSMDFEPSQYPIIAELESGAITSSNWEFYFRKLKSLEGIRAMKYIASTLPDENHDVPDYDDVLEQMNKATKKLQKCGYSNSIRSLKEIVDDAWRDIRSGGRRIFIMPRETEAGDKIMFNEREIMALCAGTGVGKTNLAIQMAIEGLLQYKKILYVCTESTDYDILMRFCSVMSGIPHWVAKNNPNDNRNTAFIRALTRFETDWKDQIFILGTRREKPNTLLIENEVSEITRKYGKIDMLFIDYVQDMGFTREQMKMDKLERLEDIVDRIHALCEENEISCIFLSQFNRTEQTGDRPAINMIKGCSKIAEKAHVILMLYRKPESAQNYASENQEACLHVAKSRNGRSGFTLDLTYEGSRYISKSITSFGDSKKLFDYYAIKNSMGQV